MLKKLMIGFLCCTIVASSFSIDPRGLIACFKETKKPAHNVIAILEAKPGKEHILQNKLEKIMKLSRQEKTCLTFNLQRVLENPCIFILCEQWESKEAHQQQFQKHYIIELAENLDELLDKPAQVFTVTPLE